MRLYFEPVACIYFITSFSRFVVGAALIWFTTMPILFFSFVCAFMFVFRIAVLRLSYLS